MTKDAPDFWLMEDDTFWRGVPPAVACFVIAGPDRLLWDSDAMFWLVRVEPAVTDRGLTTDRVLVVSREPSRRDGEHWTTYGVAAYSIHPDVPEFQRSFTVDDALGGHKIMVTTRPDDPDFRVPA